MSLVVLYFTTAASSSKGDRSLVEDPVEGAVESSELEVRLHTLEDGRPVSNVFVYSPRPSKAYTGRRFMASFRIVLHSNCA